MSGTILLAKNISFDVRAIDFARIIDVLRSFAAKEVIATKLLEVSDQFGMSMIFADELSPADFKKFAQLMREVLVVFSDKDEGIADFLRVVCSRIEEDERVAY